MSGIDRGHWMPTVSGRKIYIGDPRPEDFCIEDIAHALAGNFRFGAHTRPYYSVAQHSVLVAHAIRATEGTTTLDALCGLLHDASEAYLGDVIWPLKNAPEMAGYKIVEERFERAIALRFGLPYPMPDIVKHVDLVVLATEKRDLMGANADASVERQAALAAHGAWHCDVVEPLKTRISPKQPFIAEGIFLGAFGALMGRS